MYLTFICKYNSHLYGCFQIYYCPTPKSPNNKRLSIIVTRKQAYVWLLANNSLCVKSTQHASESVWHQYLAINVYRTRILFTVGHSVFLKILMIYEEFKMLPFIYLIMTAWFVACLSIVSEVAMYLFIVSKMTVTGLYITSRIAKDRATFIMYGSYGNCRIWWSWSSCYRFLSWEVYSYLLGKWISLLMTKLTMEKFDRYSHKIPKTAPLIVLN